MQRRKGADVQRRKAEKRQSFVKREERENTSRNAGETRSYIGSARAVLRVVIVATRTTIVTHI